MKKISTLFQRDPENRSRVLPEITSGCEWVIAGEGVATRKFDGTCVMFDEQGKWWARREVKPNKLDPPNFVQVDYDATTGKSVGWEPVEQSPFARYHALALTSEFPPEDSRTYIRPGTYELCGAKINGNPEKIDGHTFIRHDDEQLLLEGVPRSFEGLREWLLSHDYEGIVWHHPDGRMAKLKRKDFS